jgi:hypothetical protein
MMVVVFHRIPFAIAVGLPTITYMTTTVDVASFYAKSVD